ncbi:MAG: helix-turn-helix domain-containing protein [Chloroflexota bacterium]|nr:helix-turn-helix domain-containing protein [Chloroflexota bacterium]
MVVKDRPQPQREGPARSRRATGSAPAPAARGASVRPTPPEGSLTLKQAAEMLNVDLTYLKRLLDDGQIPFMGRGPQRRIRYGDLQTFKEERDARQARTLDELRDLSIAAGLDEVNDALLASLP